MIRQDIVERVIGEAKIEEVVGDFVNLKKRGSNLIGLCPFHNEKTPSFNVNIARNIFKCFGCGKGGTPVNFIMEHEKLSFPEAIRFLAAKYRIEIEETYSSPEENALKDERESMLLLNAFARDYFKSNLWNSDEGKSVGLSYLHQRDFTDEIIRKFDIGYCSEDKQAFSDFALKSQYQKEYLEKTGLSIIKEDKALDRFRDRIIFPIKNLSGRVIGFGGRLIHKSEKLAKYINSPESEVYHKSQVLFGLYEAKKEIQAKDLCYLTEGYTDVLSLHQSGIENVVASSGTALTHEQIRLIKRFTKNVVILYDADPAGIKASLRGIDLFLEEGMLVKVVLFPEGEDPDSFVKNNSGNFVFDYIQANARDFIYFKTELLINEAGSDIHQRAKLLHDITDSIARIPDGILRSVYLKRCSELLDISEAVLVNELNKIRRKNLKQILPIDDVELLTPDVLPIPQPIDQHDTTMQEREIIRILLNHGYRKITMQDQDDAGSEAGNGKSLQTEVVRFVIEELQQDQLKFSVPAFQEIYNEFESACQLNREIDKNYFFHHANTEIKQVALDLMNSKYEMSNNWQSMHNIIVPAEDQDLGDTVVKSIFHLKNKRLMKMIDDNQKDLKKAYASGNDPEEFIEKQKELDKIKIYIAQQLGIDVLR